WEPIIEDAPFLKESVSTGDFMYDLAVLDMNGDGRNDLVYTGKRDRLAVKLQTGDGLFDDEWSYDRDTPSANVGSLAVADVNNDGRDDLVVLSSGAILIFLCEGQARCHCVRADTKITKLAGHRPGEPHDTRF
ncbi:MAG: VCBS repeat-containing protein, partial [Rhizobiales bacterium]|nr:VCBS repeat-containing protein [Hyphomicrobiales bacterium]